MVLHWQFDPTLIGGLLALVVAYALCTGPLWTRIAPGTPYPKRHAAFFYGAILVIYISEGSPLHDLAERYSFTAHMFQHNLLSYLAAPLMIRGMPEWLLRPMLLSRYTKPISQVLLHPIVAFAAFSLFFSLWHIPPIYEGALQNSALHHFEHVLFLVVSLMLWWPILSPLPELPRLHHGMQMLYLFGLPVAQLAVFGAVTFADFILYPTYASTDHLTPWIAQHDQTVGGVVMKISGMFAFGVPFVMAFFRWFNEETPQGNYGERRVATRG
jgi:putative membrane protein